LCFFFPKQWNDHDAVIAIHPLYSNSYAPGIIMGSFDTFNVTVRFYDGTEGAVGIEDVYFIGLCKFEADVAEIVKLESELVNKKVVARNTFTGRYELGKS
jgi:hypothetical protein